MKHISIISVFIICILIVACLSSKKSLYDFPADMPASEKAEFKPICDKGKILYDINCAKCHTVKVKGKEIIPDFTLPELEGYTADVLRTSNPKHMTDLNENIVTHDELELIMFFLSFKKKNEPSKTPVPAH